MEQQFAKVIEPGPDVKTNISQRRADLYRTLPGRIEVGYLRYERGGNGRRRLARRIGIELGLIVAYAAWLIR